jgi:hypothetical protein
VRKEVSKIEDLDCRVTCGDPSFVRMTKKKWKTENVFRVSDGSGALFLRGFLPNKKKRERTARPGVFHGGARHKK